VDNLTTEVVSLKAIVAATEHPNQNYIFNAHNRISDYSKSLEKNYKARHSNTHHCFC